MAETKFKVKKVDGKTNLVGIGTKHTGRATFEWIRERLGVMPWTAPDEGPSATPPGDAAASPGEPGSLGGVLAEGDPVPGGL